MSASSLKILFYFGLLLVAHSVYMAHSVRDKLQEHHHSSNADGSHFPWITMAAGSPGKFIPATIPIFLELLVGITLGIIGHVSWSPFSKARLIDKNCFERYDDAMFTGTAFMHFNHRGATQSNKGTNDDSATLAEKKKS